LPGWIKLHRQILDSNVFDNSRLLHVWIWCLLKASHKHHDQIVGQQVVHLKPGQFVSGTERASREMDIPKSTFHSYLKLLQKLGNIEISSGNKFSIVTVARWGDYQGDDDIPGNKRDANGTQTETNKNVKNGKNIKPSRKDERKDEYKVFIEDLFSKFWKSYPKHADKQRARKTFEKVFDLKISKAKREQRWKNLSKHLETYLTATEGKEKKYIKNPATWLNAVDFDEPPEVE